MVLEGISHINKMIRVYRNVVAFEGAKCTVCHRESGA